MIQITEDELILFYEDGSTIEISLDKDLYPSAIDHICLIKELHLEDPTKIGSDIIRLKKIIWCVVSMIQARLNSMSSRDLDYAPLEKEYKYYLGVNAFILCCIMQMDAGTAFSAVTIPNPFGGQELLN